MIHDPSSPSSRNQRQPEQNDKKTKLRSNGMRPTRSTEELKRANSFKGFINKKDEDEISMIHEDESFPYKKKSVKIEIEDEERIPF